MPIIPLLNSSRPIADAAAPVLDHLQRPTVDNRGVMAATGALAQASQAPLMDAGAASATDRALASFGAAIAHTGSIFGAIGLKRREAESDLQIAEADTQMDAAMVAHTKWRAETNADPATWNADIAKRLDQTQAKILGGKALHPEAREQITLRLTRFGGNARNRVDAEGMKETTNRAKSVYLGIIDNATESQDEPRFNAAMETAAVKGYLWEHDAERLRQRYKDVGELKAKENAQSAKQRADLLLDTGDLQGALLEYDGMKEQGLVKPEAAETLKTEARRRGELLDWQRKIDVDPLKVRPELSSLIDKDGKTAGGTKLTPEQVVNLQHRAATAINAERGQLFDEAADAIEAGHMISDEDVRIFGRGYLTEMDVERLAKKRRSFEGPTPEERVSLANAIASYDPSTDSDQAVLTDINSQIRLLPEGFRQQFRDQLNDAVKPEAAVSSAITKIINTRLDLGSFGDVGKKDGKPVDAGSYRAAHERAADLQYRFRVWFKDNPKATLDSARQWLTDNTLADTRAAALRDRGFFERIFGSLPSGKQEPNTQQGAAPSRAARRDSIIAQHSGLDESLVDFVKEQENFKSKAYRDHAQTSIGYGTRANSEDETITPGEADLRLRNELRAHATRIDDAVKKRGWALTPQQRSALVSFDFNTGAGADVISSSGTLTEVRQRMGLYNKVTAGEHKVHSPGLERRRRAEIELFNATK